MLDDTMVLNLSWAVYGAGVMGILCAIVAALTWPKETKERDWGWLDEEWPEWEDGCHRQRIEAIKTSKPRKKKIKLTKSKKPSTLKPKKKVK